MQMIKQDRNEVFEIISEMLDNPDEFGIYPTTKCFQDLEDLLQKVRFQAVGYAWAEACSQLDNGLDPRKYNQGLLLENATKDLNPEWMSS